MSSDLLITLIFAAIAAFVIFKLRSVLGRRTGHEGSHDLFGRREANSGNEAGNDNVVNLPGPRDTSQDRYDAPQSEAEAGVRDIQRVDPTFDPDEFLDGARGAFRMIVDGFANGDRSALQQLLASDVYGNFDAAIAEREREGLRQETSIERFRGVELADAELVGREARVEVLFVTEQMKVTRDRDGKVVDGDPDATETISDLWTFARDTQSDDPNWKLIETGTPE